MSIILVEFSGIEINGFISLYLNKKSIQSLLLKNIFHIAIAIALERCYFEGPR